MVQFNLICVLLLAIFNATASLTIENEFIQIGGEFKKPELGINGILSLIDVSTVVVQQFNNSNQTYYLGGYNPAEDSILIYELKNDGQFYLNGTLHKNDTELYFRRAVNNGVITIVDIDYITMNVKNEGEIYLISSIPGSSDTADLYLASNNLTCVHNTSVSISDESSGDGCIVLEDSDMRAGKQVNSWICLGGQSEVRLDFTSNTTATVIKVANFGGKNTFMISGIANNGTVDPFEYRENRYLDVKPENAHDPMVFDIGPGYDSKSFKYEVGSHGNGVLRVSYPSASDLGNSCPCSCSSISPVKVPGVVPTVIATTLKNSAATVVTSTAAIDTRPTTIGDIVTSATKTTSTSKDGVGKNAASLLTTIMLILSCLCII
ncbi:uncharacterized protein J8A68_000386 [[Candida] subhashii]|uniref:Hyphally-regulated cell wall protein N-terminal domain-containing protein n=1 Tax=[Candida] subhashii TaxID=561895 RepID=A0A8J5QTI2_9ASCO|nr:uncharacterized protein J8A68_000386 [[Candida] subhashii]KAG7666129.1 hypothetical protein J8A68_000386 [[Candida] subhashii]